MTGTVQVPREAAETAARWLHGMGLDATGRVFDDVLSDATESAAWEPFRQSVLAFQEIARSSPAARSRHEQTSAAVTAVFAQLGLNARDPAVIRPALAALSAVQNEVLSHPACAPAVRAHLATVAAGLADLVITEALQ